MSSDDQGKVESTFTQAKEFFAPVATPYYYLCGLKYNMAASGGVLTDLYAIWCNSMNHASYTYSDVLESEPGVFDKTSTFQCEENKYVNALSFGFGPMASDASRYAIFNIGSTFTTSY